MKTTAYVRSCLPSLSRWRKQSQTLSSSGMGNAPDRMGRSAFNSPPQGEAALTPAERARRRHLLAVIRRATDDRLAERYAGFTAMAQALECSPGERSFSKRVFAVALLTSTLVLAAAGTLGSSKFRAPPPDAPVEPAPTIRRNAAKPEEASRESPFVNTLGMQFLPVPGTDVRFCIHETRWKDYAAYARANPDRPGDWQAQNYDGFVLRERPHEHPVTWVGRAEAIAFCQWLSEQEHRLYRLPTDREWSVAAGLGGRERWRKYDTPESVDKFHDEFPWGTQWPPPPGSGNYSDLSRGREAPNPLVSYIEDYDDGFPTTAPVMSFAPNGFGLYDLSGNVWECVADWWNASETQWTLRGGSWGNYDRLSLTVSGRGHVDFRYYLAGFRIVLASSNTPVPAPAEVGQAIAERQEPGGEIVAPTTGPEAATRATPFVNGLGMKFVPVPGTRVLFCVHETRWIDYAEYARANPGIDTRWQNQTCDGFHLMQREEEHPVLKVSWEDAQLFCRWLSEIEKRTYRLPTDREWSLAVGLAETEDGQTAGNPPMQGRPQVFPWGISWPPPPGAGNYSDSSQRLLPHPQSAVDQSIPGYHDGFPTTAPVMSFAPNRLGIYDLGGNVREWVDDLPSAGTLERTLRGACWRDGAPGTSLQSANRFHIKADADWDVNGFRVVLELPTPDNKISPP